MNETFPAMLQDQYRVERVLAQGGMATVYLAEDVRHQRRVAIKVLRPELAEVLGAERFLKEIRTTATLQHSHILGLIDSGTVDGKLYYVMPFVQGESLRDRLTRERQLPVADAVRIAQEVASALDYAHRQGVVHRDIKPENVLLQDGSALVADFGIALAVSQAGGDRVTGTGVTLGTPQYMAPEQAAGERTLDARSDIFALGAVTYEMLVGEPPFSGPTVQATIARVISEMPRSLVTQRRSIPLHVEAAVLKALEKLPADRFGSAKEFAAALSQPATATALPRYRTAVPTRTLALAGVAVTVAALAGGWALGRFIRDRRTVASAPSTLALVTPRLGATGWTQLLRQLAITPDGTTLLYVTVMPDGSNQLVRQSLDALQPTPIADVRPGTAAPIVSADGRFFIGWVAAERSAYRYPIAGGPGVPLSFVAGYTDNAQFDDMGALWFSPREGGGIFRLDPGQSTATLAVPNSDALRFQQLLPDRRHLIVMRSTTQTGPVTLLDLESGERKVVTESSVIEARYAAGYLLYVLGNGTLEATPFDMKRLQVTGTPVAIGTNLTGSGLGAQWAVAPNGTVAYMMEDPPSLVLSDRAGKRRLVVDAHYNYHNPRFSPNGHRIAMDFNTADERDVWIASLDDRSLVRATFERDGHDATWSPDGRTFAYLSARSGTLGLYRKRAGEGEARDSLFLSEHLAFSGFWLRDGSALVTVANDLRPNSGSDLALLRNGGRGPLAPILATQYAESFPALSPDSRWLAYTSDQSGHAEVYVRPLDGSSEPVQVSIGGATEANWGPNGREIFYRTQGDSEPQLSLATLQMTPSLKVVSRATLFSLSDIVTTNPHSNYDVSPDGKTFVMVQRSQPSRIIVIQNLAALVRKLQKQ